MGRRSPRDAAAWLDAGLPIRLSRYLELQTVDRLVLEADMQFDALSRLTQITHGGAQVRGAGNLKTKTAARGKLATYTYDNLNRLLSLQAGTVPAITFYDTDRPGFLYRVTDDAGTHTFTRNEPGESLARTSVVGGTTPPPAFLSTHRERSFRRNSRAFQLSVDSNGSLPQSPGSARFRGDRSRPPPACSDAPSG